MPSILNSLALVASLLAISSMAAPVDGVEAVGVKAIRATDPDFDPEDASYDYKYDPADQQDDYSYLQSRDTSPNPLMGRAAPLAYLDCTGIEELCDANCYAILCLAQPRVL
jgi:hypothetical protein